MATTTTAAKKDAAGPEPSRQEQRERVRRRLDDLVRGKFTGRIVVTMHLGDCKVVEAQEDEREITTPRNSVTVDALMASVAACQRDSLCGDLSFSMCEGEIDSKPKRRSVMPIRLL